MATLAAVVYPSSVSFSGSGQTDLGPYIVPTCQTLIRAEVRGLVNYLGEGFGPTSVYANFLLWAVQWVPHGDPPANIVTQADGLQWLIREQTGTLDQQVAWSPSTADAVVLSSLATVANWGGQLPVNQSVDLYLSFRPPQDVSVSNTNYIGSLRFWWTET